MSMLARFAATGAGALPTPTFVSSSTNRVQVTGNTVTAPTGIQNGDLLVAVGVRPSNVNVTPPTGFSVIQHNGSTNQTTFIATKVANSESGNYTFTWSGTNGDNVVSILVYRNATQVNTVGSIARTSSTTGTAASITPTYTGTLCAVFAINATRTITTAPAGMTQRAAYTAATPGFAVYDLLNQPASATSAASLTWSSTAAEVASLQFFVTNEPTVAPEFVASASTQTTISTTTLTVNKPSGTLEGDLMIAVMARAGTTGRSWTGDTGWTEAADQASATPSLRIAYKTAGSSEPSSYTFTVSGNGELSGCILTYRYAAYDSVAAAFTIGANPLVLTSISPSLSQSILIAAGARATSVTLGTPTSMNARVTDNDGISPSYIVCDQTVTNGPTGTRSITTGSNSEVAGIMLAIKPTRSL
jgi:hypothetical protein